MAATQDNGRRRGRHIRSKSAVAACGERSRTAMPARPPINDQATDDLFRRYKRTRDQSLRDEIICQHLHLVPGVARRFSGIGEPAEDLIQEGAIGLINAVELYDLRRAVKFTTYATHLIAGHIQHHLRDRGRLIRQPAWVQELAAKITKAADELSQKMRRQPTPAEIAAHLLLSQSTIHGALQARELSKVASLDGGEADSDVPLGLDSDKLAAARLHTALDMEDRVAIQQSIDKLRELERNVVRLFFYQELNQTEIARRLQISVNYASYLLRSALEKLRAAMQQPPPAPAPAPALAPTFTRGRGVETGKAEPLQAPPRPRLIPGLLDRHDLDQSAYFRQRVSHEVARGQRYPQAFAVIIMEFPGASAEKVSGAIPQLSKSIRKVDVMSRLGARSLGIMLPQTGKQARVLGTRLVAQARGLGIQDARFRIALYPNDGDSAEALMGAALNAVPETGSES